MRPVSSTPVVAPVAHALVALEFPGLEHDRRDAAVAFACRRIDQLASPTRAGVMAVAITLRTMCALPGGERALTGLVRHPVPLLGEYVRLLRSLIAAYVWETWPETVGIGRQVTP